MFGIEKVTIDEITVFTGRNEILVRGIQHRNHLNYESSWYINNHELNRLINQLQQNNAFLDVIDLFTTYTSADGNILQLHGDVLDESNVFADWLDQSTIAREIRA